MIGEAMALASALCWSVSVILFRRLFARGEGISPFAMNLFKNVVAIVFMAALLLVTGGTLNTDRSAEAWLRLIVSGILGIGVSDMLFFHALRRLGPGRLTVVECLYSPAVALFGVLLLGEVPTPAYALGAGLVVAGMLVVTRDERGKGADTGESPLSGALFGMGAMLTVALAIVVAKPAFDTGSLVEVALIRILSGTGALLLWMLPSAERRAALRALTRKYADDVDGVIAWADRARARLSDLDTSDDLLDELERRGASTGLATLCVGAGMGTATIIERI